MFEKFVPGLLVKEYETLSYNRGEFILKKGVKVYTLEIKATEKGLKVIRGIRPAPSLAHMCVA